MDFAILTFVTASRWLCVALWLYLWRKPPTPVVFALRILTVLWFLASDFQDGGYARAHGLESRLGKILDHGADVLFTLAVFVPLVRDAPERSPRRRRPPTPNSTPDRASVAESPQDSAADS